MQPDLFFSLFFKKKINGGGSLELVLKIRNIKTQGLNSSTLYVFCDKSYPCQSLTTAHLHFMDCKSCHEKSNAGKQSVFNTAIITIIIHIFGQIICNSFRDICIHVYIKKIFLYIKYIIFRFVRKLIEIYCHTFFGCTVIIEKKK